MTFLRQGVQNHPLCIDKMHFYVYHQFSGLRILQLYAMDTMVKIRCCVYLLTAEAPPQEKTLRNWRSGHLDSDSGKSKKKNKPKQNNSGVNFRWIATISITSFFLSVIMSYTSKQALAHVGNIIAFLILLAFIALGIVFDIIGVAATVSPEKKFHSMAARKVSGAKQAIWIVRNAEKVGSFCNDVVGDISGIISGATSAVIITHLTNDGTDLRSVILSLVITGCVSSLTIGGKAIGKTFGISRSEDIVFAVGRVLAFFSWKK